MHVHSIPAMALAVGYIGLVTAWVPGAVIFSDNFESGPADGLDPTGWVVSEPTDTSANMDTTPGWSPYNRVVRLHAQSTATASSSIAKTGLNVGNFTLDFDVHNLNPDLDNNFTVILSDAGGKVIFSGQINDNPSSSALDHFDTGLLNANEADVSRDVFHQQYLGSPPYPGIHVKVSVDHGAGTYDLTLDGTLYAGNPLASDVIGAALAKVEFLSGDGGQTTSVWIDNIVLDGEQVPEPSGVALLGIGAFLMRRRSRKVQ